MQLYLELVINGKRTGHLAPITLKNGNFIVPIQDLKAAGIPLSPWGADPHAQAAIAINIPKNVTVEYESHQQQLLITIPPDHFSAQLINNPYESQRHPAKISTGLMLNYDFYANKTRHADSYSNLWTEGRLFGRMGTLSHSGIYRRAFRGRNHDQEGYIRYDTRWQNSNEDRILTFEAGDVVTRTLSWNSPVRIGGFQISRNFSVRPDVITYPLPQFSGSTSVPTAIDLYIQGSRVQSEHIDPGPFTIINTPFINGAGEAVVVTTDALGRQVSTTVPFYVTNELLRKGLTDYAVNAGALRRQYGIESFSYADFAASGSFRYGLTDSITLESHAEGTRELKMGGVGTTFRMGTFGVTSLSYSRSSMEKKRGGQSTLGYQYNSRHFNLAAQYARYDRGYRDLANLDLYEPSQRETFQLTAGIPLGKFGNLSMGHFAFKNHDGDTFRTCNVTWSYSPRNLGIFYLSASKSNQSNDWAGFIQWIIPLGKTGRENLSMSLERDESKTYSQRIDYTRTVPSNGGFGWNLGYRHINSQEDNRIVQADLTWRTDVIQLSGGIYGPKNAENYWANASGSLVFMNGNFFPSNQIYDAFVLVSTDGVADVPVLFENSLVGKTDTDGHLMIPTVPAYYNAKYQIDPLDLPLNMKVDEIEQRIAVRSGGGHVLRFPMRQTTPAMIRLVDPFGQHLPVGSQAFLLSGEMSYVGMDGLAYFEDIPKDSRLNIRLPNGKSCQTEVFFSDQAQNRQAHLIGPLTCFPE